MLERYVVHVTKECDCMCKYCYEVDKTSGHRTWQETKPLLDDMLAKAEPFDLEFLGGEPLLNFELIKQVVEYLFPKKMVRRYFLTTNGISLSRDDILEFLAQHGNIHVGISLDGTKVMNQLRITKSGINTYDLVMNNMAKVQKALGNRWMFHLTIHPYNVGYLSDGIVRLYKKGYKRFDIGIIEATIETTRAFENRLIHEMRKVSELIWKGELEEIFITNFSYPPGEGIRTYIRDENGVVIAESYGRADDDFTHTDKYSIHRGSKTGVEHQLKRFLYDMHQNNINKDIVD